MTDRYESDHTAFDDLMSGSQQSRSDGEAPTFPTVFRGYDRAAVDAALAALTADGDARRADADALARLA